MEGIKIVVALYNLSPMVPSPTGILGCPMEGRHIFFLMNMKVLLIQW